MGVIFAKAARGAMPDQLEGACKVGRQGDLVAL